VAKPSRDCKINLALHPKPEKSNRSGACPFNSINDHRRFNRGSPDGFGLHLACAIPDYLKNLRPILRAFSTAFISGLLGSTFEKAPFGAESEFGSNV
jgi:hypothetical protein